MRSVAWSIGGGLAVAAAFLDFRLWPLAWIAFAAILHGVLDARTARESLRLGFVAGLAINIPAFYWLVGTIHRFGGFPIWLGVVFYAVLSAFSSLQVCLFALGVRRTGFGFAALAPPAIWVTLEFAFPNLFPWRLANSQLEITPLLQIGEITGPFGLSFVMIWLAAAACRAAREGWRANGAAVAAAAVATTAVAGYGAIRLPAIDRMIAEAPKVKVGIVQGNLTIEEKNDVQYFESNVEAYRDLTLEIAEEADVVIWPETVLTEALRRDIRRLSPAGVALLGLRRPLITGALTYERAGREVRMFNSVVLFDAYGTMLGMSDKQILMPFGEYLPFGSIFPFLYELSPQTGNFQAGDGVVALDVPGAGRFAPLNCYEDLKAPIARDAVLRTGAEVLFAVANDVWFGDTPAPYQHEALALWRTVENRRTLIRVTNTSVTDVIDPAGRVLVRFPVFQPKAEVVSVPRLETRTFYTSYGDVFAWAVTALALGFIAAARRPRSAPATRRGSRATFPAP